MRVQVSDTGRRIPQDDLPRIFDRFCQAAGNNGNGQHAGLGLTIAKRILELHDGSIQAVSSLDTGTTFSFSLPVWQPKG